MLEAAREVVEISSGLSRQDLAAQRLVELALTKLVESVGEAASRTPEEIRAAPSCAALRASLESSRSNARGRTTEPPPLPGAARL